MFILKETASTLLTLFCIAALGYLLGGVRVKGVGLGTAAIFLVGLVFGHFGASLPAVLQTAGLMLFIASVGLSAGPSFVEQIKRSGRAYVLLCLCVALAGSLLCAAVIKIGGVQTPLAVGLMTGAFTTSPGFAAAKEAAGDAAGAVAAGYGIVYPFGVVCKVLFIQMVPKFLRADMEAERTKIAVPEKPVAAMSDKRTKVDSMGFFSLSLAILLGILLGAVTVPLPGGGTFSLGSTGGPLVVGLFMGHFGHMGPIDLRVDKRILDPMKEIGLLFFFAGAGVEGGKGMAAILQAYGPILILYGLLFILIPLFVGYYVSAKIVKLPLLNGLGSITASMTCTPSLAALIQAAGTDDVAVAYASTYPIALITLVFMVQFLMML